MDHPLATLGGIEFMLRHFLATGAMCPVCHHGTRVVSKRWAKCKQCGQRVARTTTPTKEGGVSTERAEYILQAKLDAIRWSDLTPVWPSFDMAMNHLNYAKEHVPRAALRIVYRQTTVTEEVVA